MPATAQETETLKAALLAKGLLADRGRYTPFASIAGGANDPTSTGAPVSLQSAVAGNAAGGTGKSFPAPPAANDTELPVSDDALDKMNEGDATGLLIALGLSGAALAAYLARRRSKLANPAEEVPLVEGEVIPPKAKVAGDTIVDGEVVERATPITNTKRIAQGVATPDNEGMRALGAPKEVDVPRLSKQNDVTKVVEAKPSRKSAAQALADRARRGQPNDVDVIPLDDAFSDLTTAERRQAQTLVDQLRQNRQSGNAANRRRLTGDRTVRSTKPTGTVDEESLVNVVVRMIREGRIKPQAIARVAR